MASDANESANGADKNSDIKVHRSMCTVLKDVLDKVTWILPAIVSARAGYRMGIQELCSINKQLEKGKDIIQHCREASKLYLAITAETTLLRCQKIRSSLSQSLCLIQTMVQPLLAAQIVEVIEYINDANFSIDPSEEEAGKSILEILRQSDSPKELEFSTFQFVASKLSLTSPKTVLIESRAIEKLLQNVSGEKGSKKQGVLMYLLYLVKKYARSAKESINLNPIKPYLKSRKAEGSYLNWEKTTSSYSASSESYFSYIDDDGSTFSTVTNSMLEDFFILSPLTEASTLVQSQNPFYQSEISFPDSISTFSSEDEFTVAPCTNTSTKEKIFSSGRNAAEQIQNIEKEEAKWLQHRNTISGGAPFVICSNCFVLLRINSMTQTSKQRYILQCGKCSKVLCFKLVKRTTAIGSDNSISLKGLFDTSGDEVEQRLSQGLIEKFVGTEQGVSTYSSVFQIWRSLMENNTPSLIDKSEENLSLLGSLGNFDKLREKPIIVGKKRGFSTSGSGISYPLFFTWIPLETGMKTSLTSTLVDGTPVYGRKYDMEQVIGLILSDNYNCNVTITCMVAGSGMGKTTIAQLVYNDKRIHDAFENRVFICMSENYDEKRTIREIVEALTHVSCDITDLYKLEEIARDELRGKKLLLIMDDTDENKPPRFWYKIVELLNNGAKGSALMVTTRSTTLASAMDADHTYYLNFLTKECCWILFQDTAFHGYNPDAHPNLIKIGKKLVHNCRRNPLCIRMLADLLHQSVSERWWSAISDSYLGVMDEFKEVYLKALKVCILPKHLKKCFMYCSLFPKNYVFSKHHLVRLWLSEGLIGPVRGKRLERIGIEYFDDLIERSFFEHLHICESKDDKFVMHGVFHELAEKISSNEYFRSEGCLQRAPESTCHLSVVPYEFQTISLEDLTTETNDLQTMLFMGRSKFVPEYTFNPVVSIVGLNNLFIKFRGLITLDLSNTDIEELPNSIAFLTCLKYLGLNSTNVKKNSNLYIPINCSPDSGS